MLLQRALMQFSPSAHSKDVAQVPHWPIGGAAWASRGLVNRLRHHRHFSHSFRVRRVIQMIRYKHS